MPTPLLSWFVYAALLENHTEPLYYDLLHLAIFMFHKVLGWSRVSATGEPASDPAEHTPNYVD